jgi:hypothetical protein
MAMARRTSGWRGQKINALHVFTLQGNYSHRIRRRTTTSEITFSVFLFHSPCFYLFTMVVTRPLPLEAIKGEAGATSRGDKKTRRKITATTTITTLYTPPLIRDLGSVPSLEKAGNPYY